MEKLRNAELIEKLNGNGSNRNPPSRLFAVLRSPWMVIAVGVWVQCFTGATYDFSIYSQRIKDTLNLTQKSLDSISVSKDIGANVGIISGFIYDFCPTWFVLACAAGLSLIGNLMMWLSITLRVPTPPLWLACIYALLAANSQTFSNTAVIVTSVKIFPTCRGTIVGLMKGCLGISGAILVQLYLAAFGSSEQTFPLMMACLGPLVCVAAMFFIRPIRPVVRAEKLKCLNMYLVIILTLAAYLLTVIVLETFVSLGRPWRITILCGISVILVCPFWVAVKAELNVEEPSMAVENERDEYVLLPEKSKGDEEARTSSDNLNKVEELNKPRRGDDTSLLQAMRSLDFWFLFVASACGMGSGLTVINNMSQLGLSLGYTASEISTFVSLWSIWNFLGRFGAGHISELFFHSKGLPRPLFIVITLGAMSLGHLVIALAFPNALYIGPVLVGTCYGAQWSLMPTTASEIFGLKNFGSIFNTIAIASPISSYILSVKVAGYLYDVEAEKEVQGWLSESSSCSGSHCFRLSFFIMAGVCILGACVNVFLYLRTREFYRSLRQWVN